MVSRSKAPVLSVLLVIVALGNVALPLTNAFVGEFLMFTGVYNSVVTKFNIPFTVIAGLSIILSAVYTLNMLQKVLFGETSKLTANTKEIKLNEKLALAVLVVLILAVGVYPKPMLEMTQSTVDTILSRMVLKHP